MRVFADTHYFIALLSARDKYHRAATSWRPPAELREIVTTEFVLIELADNLSLPGYRASVVRLIRRLRCAATPRPGSCLFRRNCGRGGSTFTPAARTRLGR